MIDLGAKHIYCLDLGKKWITQLKKDLKTKKVSLSKITFISGSVTKIPLENSKFDFVACNGVIHHLPNVNLATKALKELFRVTKPGGSIFVCFGIEQPGIIEKYIFSALRKAYLKEKKFRKIIDQGDPMFWQKNLTNIAKIFCKNDNSFSYLSIIKFIKLITLETTTFMQDCLQIPVRQEFKLDKKYAFKTLKKIGAQNIRSPNDFYFKRKDIRKFFTPFHVSKKTNSISKILYGKHLKFTFDKPM